MSLYTDVRQFVSNKPIRLYKDEGLDNFNTPGTESFLLSLRASIFKQPDTIILKYPSDQISEINLEESHISFPFTEGISDPRHVYCYTASVYYGLDKRKLYIEGAPAQRLFNMVSKVRSDMIQKTYAQQSKNIEYAQKHYKDIYDAMYTAKCVYGLSYKNGIKTVKSLEKELFNLIATYIIHCKTCDTGKNGNEFVCKTGKTCL